MTNVISPGLVRPRIMTIHQRSETGMVFKKVFYGLDPEADFVLIPNPQAKRSIKALMNEVALIQGTYPWDPERPRGLARDLIQRVQPHLSRSQRAAVRIYCSLGLKDRIGCDGFFLLGDNPWQCPFLTFDLKLSGYAGLPRRAQIVVTSEMMESSKRAKRLGETIGRRLMGYVREKQTRSDRERWQEING